MFVATCYFKNSLKHEQATEPTYEIRNVEAKPRVERQRGIWKEGKANAEGEAKANLCRAWECQSTCPDNVFPQAVRAAPLLFAAHSGRPANTDRELVPQPSGSHSDIHLLFFMMLRAVAKTFPKRLLFTVAPKTPVSRPFDFVLKEPGTGSNPAYDEAVSILQKERDSLQKELDTLKKSPTSVCIKLVPAGSEEKIKQKEIELKMTYLETHWKFTQGQGDVSEDVFNHMHRKRYFDSVVSALKRNANKFNLVGDIYPELIEPSVIFETNFAHTKWFSATGHAITPNSALYSPELVISTGDKKTRYFTLMMVDLDRENLDSKSYEEWCHWLVTDIPVTNRLVIEGGSRDYLQNAVFPIGESNHANYTPAPPEKEPIIPGKVIFPYVPPHPAYSDPINNHRYVLTLFEQQDSELKFDLKRLKEIAEQIKSSNVKSVLKEADNKLMTLERSLVGKTWQFKKAHGLTVVSYGFFNSTWNVYTPAIFSAIGIHEPVFGSTRKLDPPRLIKYIENSTNLIAKHPNVLTNLGSRENWTTSYNRPPTTCVDTSSPNDPIPFDLMKHLNNGIPLPMPKLQTLSETKEQIDVLQKEDDEKWEARAKKEKIKVEELRKRETKWMRNVDGKTPRLSPIGAAALVLAKEKAAGAEIVFGRAPSKFKFEKA
ncbi:hypothetical protein HK096_002267 [Nowakowskiella sp. JEL0078]|nr:hypothetical protein HK096_002267 [Nowakowskiella sp. JEL0078]